ncbi:unnamed protein product, partial [Prunus brigantina]
MSEEIVFRILPRLPSKSLMRFKCVHKSWYTVINNPMFVESHLSNSMHNKLSTCILFNRFVQSEKELRFSFLYLYNDYNDEDEHNVNSFVEDIKFPLCTGQFIGLEDIESLYIVAHCNGMVCLWDRNDNIVLCNPAIKELKLLPKSCLPQMVQFGVGIGYDPKIKDYKIHKISYDEEIYGDRLVIFPPRKTMVFLFDTSDEVFHNILLPDCLYEPTEEYRYDMSILLWNESVALFGLDSPDAYAAYGIWVMDDFEGAKGSWTRHLTFKILVDVKRSLKLWKSDEILVVTTSEDIVSYNLGTEKPRILPMHMENPCILQNIVYVNSFV